MNPSNPNEQTPKPDDELVSEKPINDTAAEQSPEVIQPNMSGGDSTPAAPAPQAEGASAEPDNPTPSEPANGEQSQDTGEEESLGSKPLGSNESFAEQPTNAAPAPVIEPARDKKSKKKLLIAVALIVLGILLLAGGAAAAYFGYIVPNKPENVLKNAMVQTLQSDQLTFDGQLNMAEVKGDSGAVKADFISEMDANTLASSTTVNLVVSGIDVSFDARMIDDNIYLKVGDLTTVEALLSSALASFSGSSESVEINKLIDQASDLLSDQWILIDSTLVEQATPGCELTKGTSLTDADITLLQEQFENNPFVTINSSSNEVVDDVNTKKFDLTIDHKKGEAYARSLSELSFIKKLAACEQIAEEYDQEVVGDTILKNDTTDLTMWVDIDNDRLHKVDVSSLVLADDEDEVNFSFETLIRYEAFNIETPADAKPAMQVFAELQQLFFGTQQDVLGLSTLFGTNDPIEGEL